MYFRGYGLETSGYIDDTGFQSISEDAQVILQGLEKWRVVVSARRLWGKGKGMDSPERT